jgi:hypothetical protein
MGGEPTRDLYLTALYAAMCRPAVGDSDAALHAFLTLNAAYFLGEWLPARTHRALVRRLAGRLDGLAGLDLPADAAHAAQLAQHVRELVTEFGPQPWLEVTVARTAPLVPDYMEDWDEAVRAAARQPAAGGDGHGLLLAHARRRLWELEHPATGSGAAVPAPSAAGRRAARAATSGSAHDIQIVEALLAEWAGVPATTDLLALAGR